MERMINLRAFCNSLDHGKVDKNPGGEDTEKNWLGGEYKIIIVSDNKYKMIIITQCIQSSTLTKQDKLRLCIQIIKT